MNQFQKKIAHLQKKKDKITEDMNLLLEKRNKELLTILTHVPSSSVDPTILAGGLLYVCEQAISNPNLANEWKDRGLKFRRTKASNSKPLLQAS